MRGVSYSRGYTVLVVVLVAVLVGFALGLVIRWSA